MRKPEGGSRVRKDQGWGQGRVETPQPRGGKMEQEERGSWKPKMCGVSKERRWQMFQKSQAITQAGATGFGNANS